jgi:hypothetical protein
MVRSANLVVTRGLLCMLEPSELHDNASWRMAVWALRTGYFGLTIAIAGLFVMLSGSSPWLLAVGAIIWLAAAAVTVTGVLAARHELRASRPGYWSMRWMLIYDTVHARSSSKSTI